MNFADIADVVILPPKDMLENLVRKISEDPKNRLEQNPRVTVRTGYHAITGIPVKIREVDGHRLLLLYNGDIDSSEDGLTIIALNLIESISVHRATDHLQILNGGKITLPLRADVPSKLALARKLEEINHVLVAANIPAFQFRIDWGEGDPSAELRFNMQCAVGFLEHTVKQLLADDMGRNALGGLKAISLGFQVGEGMSVTRDAQHVTINISNFHQLNSVKDSLLDLLSKVL